MNAIGSPLMTHLMHVLTDWGSDSGDVMTPGDTIGFNVELFDWAPWDGSVSVDQPVIYVELN